MSQRFLRRAAAVLVVALLCLATVTGTAAAASRTGGTVVVPAGETVTGGLNAAGGTIEIHGTVQGDLQAAGGTILVADDGSVTGNVQATGGTVEIDGTVNGDVHAAGGTVSVGPNAVIDGDLSVNAGSATIAGTINGTVTASANTIDVASTATVGGDLVYDGTLNRADGSQVGGQVREDTSLGSGGSSVFPHIPSWVGTLYGFLVNLVIGAVLLLAFPRFSSEVADGVAGRPLRSAGWGLAVLLGTPIALFVAAITVVGLPLALAGVLVYVLLLWTAGVYGQYALGAWLLSYTEQSNRFLALLLGAVVLAAVQFVPYLRTLVNAVLLVLALGALTNSLYGRYRRENGADDDENGGETEPEPVV